MKGSYFLGNQTFEVRDLPDREPAADEVVVRVAACGVCGTDVHIYHGDKGSAEVNPPVILGHEFSGVVEKTGSAVHMVKPGDHVTVDPNIYCGECYYCRVGKKQLCTNLYAIGVNRDGGFAECCIVPESQCYKLADDVPLACGAMAEPLACCIHGIDRAGIRPGDSVCVIGGGTIGQLMVQLAGLSGASTVILSEPVEKRRQIGLELGADAAIDPTHEPICERVRGLLGMDGVDVVIECVGSLPAAQQAFDLARRGTTILFFSVPKSGAVQPLSMEDVYQKELTIVGSLINPDTHLRAVEMINSKRIRLEPLITHRFPIAQVKEAIQMQMSDASIKVMVGEENAAE